MLFLRVPQAHHPGGRRAPRIRQVRVADDWVVLQLLDGRQLRLPTSWSPALAQAPEPARRAWYRLAGGRAVVWPSVGEAIALLPLASAAALTSPRIAS